MAYGDDGIDDVDDVEDAAEEARLQRDRHACEEAFLNALAGHVSSPSEVTWEVVTSEAERLRGLGGFYVTGGSDWSREVGNRIGPLLAGDVAAWGEVMLGLERRTRSPGDTGIARLRAASPFAGRLLVFAHGGRNATPTYHGDVAPLLAHALSGTERVELAGGYDAIYVLDAPGSVPDAAPPRDPGPLSDEDVAVGC